MLCTAVKSAVNSKSMLFTVNSSSILVIIHSGAKTVEARKPGHTQTGAPPKPGRSPNHHLTYTLPGQKYSSTTKYPCTDCAMY